MATSWAAAAGTVRMAILSAVLTDKIRKFVHAQNRLADFFVALTARVGVKAGDDFKSFLSKTAIRKQREAEMPDADQNDRLQARRAEFIGDFF